MNSYYRLTSLCESSLENIFNIIYKICHNPAISINKIAVLSIMGFKDNHNFKLHKYSQTDLIYKFTSMASINESYIINEDKTKLNFYNTYKNIIFNECDLTESKFKVFNCANLILNRCFLSLNRSKLCYYTGSSDINSKGIRKYFLTFDSSNILHLKIINRYTNKITIRILKEPSYCYIHNKSITNI